MAILTPAPLVTSVSPSDNTLIISPTLGAVLAAINLANANTWSAQQKFTFARTLIGTSTDDGTNALQVLGVSGSGLKVVSGTVGELLFNDGTNNPTLSILRIASSGSSTINIGSTNTGFTQMSSGEFRFFCATGSWFPTFYSNGFEAFRVAPATRNVLIGTTTDGGGAVSILAGTATRSQINLAASTLLTTPVNGAVEGTSTHIYYTAGGVRYQLDQQVLTGSFSGTGTGTTTFTITTGVTMSSSTYKVFITPTSLVAAALFYVSSKSPTQFVVTYPAGLTGSVTFDWMIAP